MCASTTPQVHAAAVPGATQGGGSAGDGGHRRPETIAAAWLHDTVEDTTAAFGDLERAFGPELTGMSKPSDGNHAVRKATDLRHSADASAPGPKVKLADLADIRGDIQQRVVRMWLFGIVTLVETNLAAGIQTRCPADSPTFSTCPTCPTACSLPPRRWS